MSDFVNLSANLITAKNQVHGADVFPWLFDLQRDSTNVSRYTDDNAPVTFDGNTYTPKALKFGPPPENMETKVPVFTVSVGNADKVQMAYWRNGKYKNQPVVVRLTNRAYLSSAVDQRVYRGVIKRATWDEQWIVFHCGMKNLQLLSIPNEPIFRIRCGNIFKGADGRCGYAGGVTECDLRWQTCIVLGNEARFWGAPAMPVFFV